MTIPLLPQRGLFVALAAISCCLLAPVHAQNEVMTSQNLLYKSGPDLTDDEKALCQLDVYAPKGARNAPVVVWFHGGGFTGGDKASKQTANLCKTLAQEGFVVASANYRLNPKVKFPAYIEDAAASVAWMKKEATKWGGDGQKLFIGGHSAGGYLAALVGSDPKYLRAHNIELSQINGLIPLSGQMTTHFTVQLERGLAETTLSINDASPLFFVRKDTPPMLLIYGEKDLPLRAEENLLLAAALKAAGNERAKCVSALGRDHGGTISHFTQTDDPVRMEILAFVRAHEGKLPK